MLKKVLLALAFFVLVSGRQVFALDEFKTVYNIIYDNYESAETLVTQKIEITNLKDDVVATTYTVTLKQMQVYEISAEDELGPMEIEETKTQDTTTITLLFNNSAVGKGRTNTFTIKYKTKDIAAKIGEIYSVKIPKVAGLDNVREYNVQLNIPKSYGPKIFITPETTKIKETETQTTYIFDRDQLENAGISASFGAYQVVNFNLKYQLHNNTIFSAIYEIALPPDIKERQQVSFKKLDPEPKKIYEDEDGNLIAQYVLKQGEAREIELIGTARLMGTQINVQNGGRLEDIDDKLIKKYTKTEKYWEVTAPQIQSLKSKLFDPEANVSQNAKNVYDYVVAELDYDHSVAEKDYVERNGALKALTKQTPAACMEFTDLFITLARAMGIPARELNGYAINNYQLDTMPLSIKLKSGDFLHSWAEFYDPNYGWVAVDPTWGNTSELDFFSKLDNSHFVFSIKGLSSEHPLPAGLYINEDNKNLVSVDVSQNSSDDDFRQFAGLFKVLNLNPLNWLTNKNSYLIKNQGGTYIYNLAGKDLLPYQNKRINLSKDIDVLRFEDFNGKIVNQNIVYLEKNPKTYVINPYYIVFSVLLGLLLCSLIYYFLILKGFLKKLPLLRLRRPQDQDQKRSPRS